VVKTALGWQMWIKGKIDYRSLQNWPTQSTAADILKVLTIALVEGGVPTCALVHDAALVEARVSDIHDVVAATRSYMVKAGQVVVGADLRVDAQIVREGVRFADKPGEALYRKVVELLPGVAA
jgi:DNA polymerase I-like protein with 3'-5' exonuclease and polymerase domains